MSDCISQRLAEIRDRAEKASAGPWESVPLTDIASEFGCSIDGAQTTGVDWHYVPDDAEFIAHARTDIPYLLARLTALEAELTEARAERDDEIGGVALHVEMLHRAEAGLCDWAQANRELRAQITRKDEALRQCWKVLDRVAIDGGDAGDVSNARDDARAALGEVKT